MQEQEPGLGLAMSIPSPALCNLRQALPCPGPQFPCLKMKDSGEGSLATPDPGKPRSHILCMYEPKFARLLFELHGIVIPPKCDSNTQSKSRVLLILAPHHCAQVVPSYPCHPTCEDRQAGILFMSSRWSGGCGALQGPPLPLPSVPV